MQGKTAGRAKSRKRTCWAGDGRRWARKSWQPARRSESAASAREHRLEQAKGVAGARADREKGNRNGNPGAGERMEQRGCVQAGTRGRGWGRGNEGTRQATSAAREGSGAV